MRKISHGWDISPSNTYSFIDATSRSKRRFSIGMQSLTKRSTSMLQGLKGSSVRWRRHGGFRIVRFVIVARAKDTSTCACICKTIVGQKMRSVRFRLLCSGSSTVLRAAIARASIRRPILHGAGNHPALLPLTPYLAIHTCNGVSGIRKSSSFS
jgi:hypothetical protein